MYNVCIKIIYYYGFSADCYGKTILLYDRIPPQINLRGILNLYWGSVRFFKHLILSTVALMIIVPTVLAVYFGVENHRSKQLAEEYKKLKKKKKKKK